MEIAKVTPIISLDENILWNFNLNLFKSGMSFLKKELFKYGVVAVGEETSSNT